MILRNFSWLQFHPYSILTGDTKVEFVITDCVLSEIDLTGLYQQQTHKNPLITITMNSLKWWCGKRDELLKIQYIYYGRKLLVPVACFAILVQTSLWAIWAEQHAMFTLFFHIPTFFKLSPKCNERSDPLWKFCGDNSSFFNFFKLFQKKKKKIIIAILCNFSMRLLKYLKKKLRFFCPPKHRKTALKSCS